MSIKVDEEPGYRTRISYPYSFSVIQYEPQCIYAQISSSDLHVDSCTHQKYCPPLPPRMGKIQWPTKLHNIVLAYDQNTCRGALVSRKYLMPKLLGQCSLLIYIGLACTSFRHWKFRIDKPNGGVHTYCSLQARNDRLKSSSPSFQLNILEAFPDFRIRTVRCLV